VLYIPGNKGNANQNHIKIPPHSYFNGYHQEYKQQQMLVKMWGKGALVHYWWLCKLVQHHGKQYGGLQKTTNRTTIGSSNTTLRDTPKGI
jgi:hypothetical protein